MGDQLRFLKNTNRLSNFGSVDHKKKLKNNKLFSTETNRGHSTNQDFHDIRRMNGTAMAPRESLFLRPRSFFITCRGQKMVFPIPMLL